MVKCPCCGYDTLTEEGGYDTCDLCWWEDDGQGDYDAHIVVGGPNSDYSLLEARNNFENYLVMWRPSDSRFRELKNDRIDEIKRRIMILFNDKKNITNGDELVRIDAQIIKLRETLREEVDKQIKRVEKGEA